MEYGLRQRERSRRKDRGRRRRKGPTNAWRIRVDVFRNTRNRKQETYSDVVASGRVSLVVLAALTGGRFSDEAAQVVRSLVALKCERAPKLLRGSFRQAFSQRWWQILSCAVQRATAASLEECFPPLPGPWEIPEDFVVVEEECEAPSFSRLSP